jgi:hypothetical protein
MSDEPIVIWGPGSEWFWIMLQTVVVTVTLIGIYFQFRLQRAANAFDQLNRMGEQWDSEPMLRARLGAARAIAAGREVPESSLTLIGNYWENVATLVRQGHVNEHVVAETFGNNTTIWWSALKSSIGAFREGRLDPTIFENFEWLAHRFIEGEAKSGPGMLDRATLARVMEAAIPALEDRIRIAEESRMAPAPRAPAARPRSADRR